MALVPFLLSLEGHLSTQTTATPQRERPVAVLVNLPPQQAARLREAAQRDGRPTANMARHLIERGLQDMEGQRE